MRTLLPALLIALAGVASCGQSGAVPARPAGSAAPTASTTSTTAPSAGRPLAGRVVVIDPGHQLGNSRHRARIERRVWIGNGYTACNTTGTSTDSGFPEATFTWRVAKRMRIELRALGARVILTRKANSRGLWGPCVDARGRRGNAVPADLKVSIHGDGSYAAGAHGFHVIYAPDHRPTADSYRGSRRLAESTRAAMGRAGFARANYLAGGDGLDVRSDLGTLNLSNMPTVMVECGNMRNPADARRMSSPSGEQRYAAALVRGVRSFLVGR